MSIKENISAQDIRRKKQGLPLDHKDQGMSDGGRRSSQACLLPEHHEMLTHCMNKDATLVRLLKDNPGQIFIAGSFPVCVLTRVPFGDVDIFGMDRLQLFEAAKAYSFYSRHHSIESTKYTLSVCGKIGKVQFVLKDTYESAQECIDSFDFTACQAAVWFENGEWQTTCSPYFYRDLKTRRLRFINQERVNESPGASLQRAAKYTERGFKLLRVDKLALLDRFFQNYHRKIDGQPENIACGK